jgi:predicted dehydrogenase
MAINHIAIVGVGSIGCRHLKILRDLRPDIEITLVRSGIGKLYDEISLANRVVSSLEEAIALNIQAAIISSPASKHIEQALVLADAGIHLLVEKPISHDSKNLKELQNLVIEKKIVFLIGYIFRYEPAANKFSNLLKQEATGQILHARIESGSYLPDWRPNQNYLDTVSANKEMGGGALLELSHEIDYANWFFNIDSVFSAYLYNSGTLGVDVEESADLVVVSKQNFPVSIHLDFCRSTSFRKCRVFGTDGDIEWDALNKKVTLYPKSGDSIKYSFEYDRDDLYQKQLIHFFDCIENNTKPIIKIQDSIKVMEIIENAKKRR